MVAAVKLQIDDVIDEYGNDTTIVTHTYNADTDEWGDPVSASDVSRVIKAVSDENLIRKLRFTSFGRLADATLTLIVKGDEVFDTSKDKVQFSGNTYNIMSVEQYKVSDIILAQALILGSE